MKSSNLLSGQTLTVKFCIFFKCLYVVFSFNGGKYNTNILKSSLRHHVSIDKPSQRIHLSMLDEADYVVDVAGKFSFTFNT